MNIALIHEGPQQVIFEATISQDTSSQQSLPLEFVIKPQFKDCPDMAFLHEGVVYNRLAPIQGNVVPTYFGIWDFQHAGMISNSYLIEKVYGTPLTNYKLEERVQFKSKILRASKILSFYCVIHGDIASRNLFVTASGEIRLIDFDLAEICQTEEEALKQNTIDVETYFNDGMK